ncbi:MAG: hypothetical protein A2W33_05355 [Chloroflexi bacterium RBG_16_52_11]|nr:MAG: hypothetical protein A2W33_05355 [Chloroflexi bacterium RBG_16_52_11]
MNFSELLGVEIIGLVFVLVFLALIILFIVYERSQKLNPLRPIRAFDRLRREIGLAVEAGKRLHVSLGRGGITGLEGGSALVGLSTLDRIARTASISDRPPVATSGDGTLTLLSQNTARGVFTSIGLENQFEPSSGRLVGVTPFSYAAGTLPVIYDEQVAANILAGHFGSEVALITDAAERSGGMTLGGSDNLSAQAVLYAASDEPLIGEELYATGAYLKAGPAHNASVRAQDVFRWVLIAVILVGAALKFFGIL